MITKEPTNDFANAKAKRRFLKSEPIQEVLFYFFGKTTDGQIFRKVGYCNRQ